MPQSYRIDVVKRSSFETMHRLSPLVAPAACKYRSGSGAISKRVLNRTLSVQMPYQFI